MVGISCNKKKTKKKQTNKQNNIEDPAKILYNVNWSCTKSGSEFAGRGGSIGCVSAWYADRSGLDPRVRQNILSMRFGHEKNSTTILSLPLIQERQLSVTGERIGTKYW